MRYLVKMTPLEPYAFGTDQTFAFHGVAATGKETYFVRSNMVPEQTTILGMLRYIILEMEGLLKTDFQYSPEERAKMTSCIGPESFRLSEKQKQDFGYIHEISPLFLMDEQNHIYIKNPFHNKDKNRFAPMEMMEGAVETSNGRIRLPKAGEYLAKEGHGNGYYDLTDGTVCKEELFRSDIVSGNRKNGKEENQEDSLFKREVISLKKGFSFAVYVDAERLPKSTIAYMGQKKSAFRVTAKVTEDQPIADQVRAHQAFAEQKEPWFFALSDILLSDPVQYDSFCIVEEKQIRNLETVYSAGKHVQRLKRSDRQYNLIQSGSVFHAHCPFEQAPENWCQIGYNQVIRLGGN